MSDWRALLRAHDPADGAIDAARAEHIRRSVIAAAAHSAPTWPVWPWRLAFAGVVVLLFAAGAGDDGRAPAERLAPAPPASSGERRQVQFDTPGGTRIIWEINPDFTLREAIP